MHKVTERARPYLQRRLVNVTRPDKWSYNINFNFKDNFRNINWTFFVRIIPGFRDIRVYDFTWEHRLRVGRVRSTLSFLLQHYQPSSMTQHVAFQRWRPHRNQRNIPTFLCHRPLRNKSKLNFK